MTALTRTDQSLAHSMQTSAWWCVVALPVTHCLKLAMEPPVCDVASVPAVLPTYSHHEKPNGSSGKPQAEAPHSRSVVRSAMLTLTAPSAVKI